MNKLYAVIGDFNEVRAEATGQLSQYVSLTPVKDFIERFVETEFESTEAALEAFFGRAEVTLAVLGMARDLQDALRNLNARPIDDQLTRMFNEDTEDEGFDGSFDAVIYKGQLCFVEVTHPAEFRLYDFFREYRLEAFPVTVPLRSGELMDVQPGDSVTVGEVDLERLTGTYGGEDELTKEFEIVPINHLINITHGLGYPGMERALTENIPPEQEMKFFALRLNN